MIDLSKSVLQDRFRPLAICRGGSVPVRSVGGQLDPHRHEQPNIWSRPCSLLHAVETHRPFGPPKDSHREMNVRRAERLPLFPEMLLFADAPVRANQR